MGMTLKLSHIAWDTGEGPHTWKLGLPDRPPVAQGPARLTWTAASDLEAGLELEFDGRRLDDIENNRAFVRNASDGGEDYIWRIDECPFDLFDEIGLARLSFESNPAHDIQAWIGGVRQVTSLGDVQPSTDALKAAVNGNDPRFAHLCGPGAGIEPWTWIGEEKKTIRKVLMVSLDEGETRTMLVERAWLLGPNGDTLERICP